MSTNHRNSHYPGCQLLTSPYMTKERALKLITQWLVEEAARPRNGLSALYVDLADPTEAVVDGSVNLERLAEALAEESRQ